MNRLTKIVARGCEKTRFCQIRLFGEFLLLAKIFRKLIGANSETHKLRKTPVGKNTQATHRNYENDHQKQHGNGFWKHISRSYAPENARDGGRQKQGKKGRQVRTEGGNGAARDIECDHD